MGARLARIGQKCPASGQWSVEVKRAKGGRWKRLAGRQVTMVKGRRFPAWHDAGPIYELRFVLTDRTRHGGRR